MAGALILDGHSRAAIEATQALGRAGVDVIVSAEEENAIAFRSRYPRRRLSQPHATPPDAVIQWLEELHRQNDFDLIIPCTETSLQVFLHMPENHPSLKVAVLPSGRALHVALDKNLTNELALRLGIPVPATRLIRSLADVHACARFPVVLKPVRSKITDGDKLKTFEPAIVRDEDARNSVLLDWIPRMSVIEQEYVKGRGVGIEMLYREGKLAWYFAHERLHEWPLTGGASTYRVAIVPPPPMLEASQRFLDSLNWHGVAMVEFKRSADGSFTLMEVNPRLWGSLALSIASGVNFPLGLWQIAVGGHLAPQPQFRRGLRVRHVSGDFQWLKANLLANRADPLLLIQPRLRSFVELALPIFGRERWDHFQWRDPGPAFHELGQIFRIAGRAALHRIQALLLSLRRRRLIGRSIAQLALAGSVKKPQLLFVCQANICRSPFAAVVAGKRLPVFEIESAGFDRRAGRPTPPNVAHEAARLGFDMSECASKPITEDHIRRADLILVMDLMQLKELSKQFPDSKERTVPLGLFAPNPTVEIEDPNHKDAATTSRVLTQIVSAIDRLALAVATRPSLVSQNSPPSSDSQH